MNEQANATNLRLERYALRELSAPEMEELTLRLKEDPELRERLRALEESNLELRRLHPAALMAEQIQRRLDSPPDAVPARAPLVRLWPVPAALAAALLLLALPHTTGPVATPTAPETLEPGNRIKGLKPRLALFRKADTGSERLGDGDLAHEGDQIRLGYQAAGHRYGVIISIDGRGAVTLHLPLTGDRAAQLESSGTVLLNHAYQLDDAPLWERFYFVVANAPFDVGTVMAAARGLAAAAPDAPTASLELPDDFDQSIVSLQKGTLR